MIVPSMTAQEIHKEVMEDIKTLGNKVDRCRDDFRKTVLRSSRYPVSKSYDCKTQEKKNLFIVELIAPKRSFYDKPILSIHGIYSRPEGKYAVAPSIDKNLISIYPPHFFKRYRERIVKDTSLSNEEIIRRYFKNDWGFMIAVVDKHFESVYHCFENDNDNVNESVDFVAATSQGYCFGTKQGYNVYDEVKPNKRNKNKKQLLV